MEATRGKNPSITFADIFENANVPKNVDKVFEACMPKMTEGKSFGIVMMFGTSGEHNPDAEESFYKLWEK